MVEVMAESGANEALGRRGGVLARLCSRDGKRRAAGCPDEPFQGEMPTFPGCGSGDTRVGQLVYRRCRTALAEGQIEGDDAAAGGMLAEGVRAG